MMLQFVKISKTNGVEKKKVIGTWSDVDESHVASICENFMQGFLYAMDNYSQYDLIRPMVMIMDGWRAQTRFYDRDNGTRWMFQDENGKDISRWDKRLNKE